MNSNNHNRGAAFGNYKEYLLIERSELERIEKEAIQKLENNEWRGKRDEVVEANAILNIVKQLKQLNIYNREFEFKG